MHTKRNTARRTPPRLAARLVTRIGAKRSERPGGLEIVRHLQIGVFAFGLAKPTLPLLPLGLLAPMMWPRFRNFRKASTLLAMTALGIKLIQLVEDAMMAASSKWVSFDEAFCAFKRGAQGRLLCRRLVLPCHGIRPHRTSVVPPVTQNPLNVLRT